MRTCDRCGGLRRGGEEPPGSRDAFQGVVAAVLERDAGAGCHVAHGPRREHVGRTGEYLYYIMELADDHVAGPKIDIANYVPRTLKSDLDRHKHLAASESIQGAPKISNGRAVPRPSETFVPSSIHIPG